MTTVSSAAADSTVDRASSDVRYAFGRNWQRFLTYLDEDRITEAEKSLCSMLQVEDLKGQSFLDIGCGSGLFSLAAMRLGACRVHSFDYDGQSVACAQELKRRYFSSASSWTIEEGSVMDESYLKALGRFDVVYSWGVLHHTGHMWQALKNVIEPVKTGGKLFIAIYNDQGRRSRLWSAIKRRYCRNLAWRTAIITVIGGEILLKGFIKDVFLLRKNPLARFREYKSQRGMSYLTDVLDWLGGYPFEVARPEAIFDFFHERGFELTKLKTPVYLFANNEFVFLKRESLPS